MKKALTIIMTLCLIALLCAAFVACDNSTDTDDNGKNQYEVSKYTVTFNTDGDTVLANPVLNNIKYGETISKPKDADGNEIKPVKRGYTFRYWSKDGATDFFATPTPIVSNTTLTAIYTPNVYLHSTNLRARLTYNDGKFELKKNKRKENEITLPSSEIGANTSIKSTYGSSSGKFACPTSSEGVKFCFWYYIDDSGKPVQFTSWKLEKEETVNMLSKYMFTEALELYPIFEDDLPKVTVKFVEPLPSGAEYVYTDYAAEYTFGHNIPVDDKNNRIPEKAGYSFDYWYYVVETKGSDGNIVKTNEQFIFEEGENKPTSPMDAAQSEDNFTPVSLKLYAKWTREINIASVEKWRTIYDQLRTKDPSDEEKAAIEEILSANIHIFDVDFGRESFEPLFDAEHRFVGTIDGGRYEGAEHTLAGNYKIKGGVFGDENSASVFGYVDGVIKNLDFENITLKIKDSDGAYASRALIGVVATENRGTIDSCNVNINMTDTGFDKLHTVVFGGIAAVNNATKSGTTGIITQCKVKIVNFNADCEALTFGGIAGSNSPLALVSSATVDITVFEINCTDDGIPANGNAELVMGGVTGVNGGAISRSSVNKFDVLTATCLPRFLFGGVTGSSTGTVGTSYAVTVLGSEQKPVTSTGSRDNDVCIGGMIGYNEGSIINCHCDAQLYVGVDAKAQNGSIVSVGGIVGNNYSTRDDKNPGSTTSGIGAINYCYSVGKVSVSVAQGIDNVTVYAGGIAGRNSKSKISGVFTLADISVVNSESATTYVGQLFASMEQDSKVNAKCYWATSNIVTVNGKAASEDDKTENVSLTVVGHATEEANFSDVAWVIGAGSTSSSLGFNGEVWKVTNGLPELIR